MTDGQQSVEGQARTAGRGELLSGVLVVAAVAYGVWVRVRGLGLMPLYGDEYHGARVTSLTWREILVTYDSYGTHVPLPLLQRLASWLTEPGVMAFRMPAVLAGLATLLLFYPLARRLIDAPAAALATVALALSPIHVYYTRFGRAYSITILFGLLLLVALHRAEQRRWRAPWTTAAVVLLAAATPWVHLSSAGFVAALGLAAIGLALLRGGAREALRPALAFAGAAALCAALFAPVFEQVVEYANKLPEARKARPDGVLGIATLVVGTLAGGVAWLVLVPLAAGMLWRRQRALAALLAAAVLGPVAFLLATRPHGMEYAYARYLLNAVPAMLLLIAWLFVRLGGPTLGGGLGVVLAATVWCASPPGPLHRDQRGFANTYLALYDLPAFEPRFRFTPEIYDEIAADEQAELIIEAPIIHSRAVLLYRNYFLTHGKDVLMGTVTDEDVRLNGPYAWIGDPLLGRRSGASYLILHKDVEYELGVYWRMVYEALLPGVARSWTRGLMERHRTYFLNTLGLKEMIPPLVDALTNQLGAPYFEDDIVYCWKLKKRGRRGKRGERSDGAQEEAE